MKEPNRWEYKDGKIMVYEGNILLGSRIQQYKHELPCITYKRVDYALYVRGECRIMERIN
jgi:hypothetical protein